VEDYRPRSGYRGLESSSSDYRDGHWAVVKSSDLKPLQTRNASPTGLALQQLPYAGHVVDATWPAQSL